jgi:hypothetical protein
MWTPRRIVLLAIGYMLVMSSYLGYLVSSLGDIDGLPTLPENLRPDPNGPGGPTGPTTPRCGVRRVEEKIKQAFGADCPELKWPIQLEANNKTLIVAAEDFKIEEDGRICLLPASLAVFGRDAPPGSFPEINTLRGTVAYIKFDRPISNLSEIGGRKIVGAEISGNIQITSNRRTPDRGDDLVMLIGTGPLYYSEPKHLIWTHDTVHVQDFQSKPKPMEVWGKGMEVELVTDTTPDPAPRPTRNKQFNDKISGIKRVQLQSNVDMKLFVDGNSGFPGGNHDGNKPPEGPAPAAQPPAEKAQLSIRTSGRFRYDFLKEYDVARFDVPEVDPRQPARAPQHIVVERYFASTNNRDHLFCANLELHLKKKDNNADQKPGQPKKPEPADASVVDRNMDIIFARAQGPTVTLTSDAEKLEANGVDLIYDARIPRTILRGEPQMTATRDRNRIFARELQITEHRPTNPNQRSYQTTLATGPGHVDMLDEKNREKITGQAFWNEKMTTSRDGEFDLIVLTGAGKFHDRENDQLLQGETLKVWMTLPDSPPPGTTPAPGADQQAGGRRVHHLEAIGNVSTRSKDLNIHDTSRLVVRFRDVLPAAELPAPMTPVPGTAPPSGRDPRLPAPTGPMTPMTPMAPVTNPIVVGVPNAPTTPKKDEPPRPIFLSARNIEAWVVRAGPKNDLERLWCEGTVDVKQAASDPKEKGLAVNGDTLAMDCHPEGNLLEVTGDLAQLRSDRLYILGPVVNIDQPRNLAWVNGAGAMQVESKTNFAGENLGKAVPMTILWKKKMFFTGITAEFEESIQASQENSLLSCEVLTVFFDRTVSLKPTAKPDGPPKTPGKEEEPARVKNLVCDHKVRIEESTLEGDKVIKYQRIESGYVAMNALEADDDPPAAGTNRKAEDKPAEGNEVRASGEGTVRLFQIGGTDPLAQPMPMGQPAPMRQGQNQKPNQEKKEDEPKLTFIQYRNSMYANSKKNLASFWGQVRVINLPSKDHLREIDLEKLVGDLPPDAMYLASDQLTVMNRGTKERSQQEMLAKGRVIVKAKEFWGRAETVSFNEAKDQIILDGGEDGSAILFKDVGRGAPPQKIEGKKITYIRSTGAFRVDEGRWISGQ